MRTDLKPPVMAQPEEAERRTTSVSCQAHLYHAPEPDYQELHHVLPLGWGGDPKGLVWALCPTGHANVHRLLDAYRKYGGRPPWNIERRYGPVDRALAAEGWRRYLAQFA
jgi:hypothetical protein